ncbi:MAG: response regulator transcription factor [Tepidisphaeraceae bacterium]
MATQPEAEDWIIRQNLTLAPGVPDRHFGCGRKTQVLHALKSGKSEKEIAYFLNLSTHTVHSFVKSLYRDYGVHSRAELLSRFIIHPRFSPTAD